MRVGAFVTAAASFACAAGPSPTPGPPPEPVVRVDTVIVTLQAPADSGLREDVARLQLQVYERDAQIADLQAKLDNAINEVVRSMARLQSLASRAEAASAIAEAEIAMQALEGLPGSAKATDLEGATRLLQRSNAEFDGANFGGAVYLATEARNLARRGVARLSSADPSGSLGETLFTIPVQFWTTTRSNVRGGPGLDYGVEFTLDPGASLQGHGFVDSWVRISDDQGRSGWIFHSLVTRERGQ